MFLVNVPRMIAATLFVGLVSGCHCAPEQTATPTAVPVVDVGGAVNQPGAVAIPRQGLTLLQSIIRSGGLNATFQNFRLQGFPQANSDPKLLVRFQRHREVYHFPLKMVENDLAGAIQLSPGDVVQIVLAKDTALFSARGENSSDTVRIAGFHELGGEYTIENLKKNVQGDLMISEFIKSRDVVNGQLIAPERDGVLSPIVMITRSNIRNGYTVEHFVLPTDYHPDKDTYGSELFTQNVLGGDQLLFASIQDIPIVAAGVIAPEFQRLLNSGVPAEQCHRLLSSSMSRQAALPNAVP